MGKIKSSMIEKEKVLEYLQFIVNLGYSNALQGQEHNIPANSLIDAILKTIKEIKKG